MSAWRFFTDPSPEWTAVCRERGSFFHIPAWQSVLSAAFGARACYGLTADDGEAVALTIFPLGPFRVAFAGFPAGGLVGGRPFTAETAVSLSKAAFPAAVHMLRLVVSPFPELVDLPFPFAETWETAVLDLPNWDEKRLSSAVRRNVRKAEKQGIIIVPAVSADAPVIFQLYRETVKRHGGSLRYNPGYFQALVKLAQETAVLRCWLAKKGEETAAFLVAAQEGDIVYYLHGAVNRIHQQARPGDLLFHRAIQWAKNQGAGQFNMMASPLSQPGLVRYKEKWGGVTARQRTYDVPVNLVGNFSMWLIRGYKIINENLSHR
ncbi:MAG: GNAT family N-acetyltransferase [Anaerolineae bacterium]